MGLSLRKLGSRITDIFDANSGADQKKRQAAGQARLYADQQRALGNSRPANNVGQAFLGNAARTINTVGGIARETPGTFKAGIGMATGNQAAVNNALDEIKRAQVATRNPNAGLFGAGTIYKNANDTPLMGETAKRFGTSYLAGAGELAPIPATKSIQGANLAIKAGKVGLASGAANIAADAGNQYINKGKIDLKQSAIAGGTGLALGTAAPLAWAGTKVAAKGATNALEKASQNLKLTPLNQAGGIKINNPLSAKTGLLINNPDGAKYGGLKINNPDGAKMSKPLKIKNNTGAPLVGEGLSGAAQQSRLSKLSPKSLGLKPLDQKGGVRLPTLSKRGLPDSTVSSPKNTIDDQLEKEILGVQGDVNYKQGTLGVLGEKLSPNKQIRKATQAVEGGINKVLRGSLESGNRVVRTPGRAAAGISRQAGRTPEELAQYGRLQGGKQVGDELGLKIAQSGDEAIKQGVNPVAVAEALDPKLTQARGGKAPKLTPAEASEVTRLRKIIDLTHEGSYQIGLLDDKAYQANKGTYFPRNFDAFFEDDVTRQIAKNNKLDLNIFKQRKDLADIPKEVLEKANRDPYYMTALRVQQYAKNKAVVDHTKWLAEAGGILDAPKSGYVKVPDSPAYGAIKGKYVLKEQLEDLQGFIYETDTAQHVVALLNTFDRNPARQFLKKTKTVYNPGVRIGNRTFNYLTATLNGINPITYTKNWARGRQMMSNKSPEFLEATKAGVFGSSIIDKELYQVGDALTPVKGNMASKGVRTADNAVTNTYRGVDDKGKMATYLTFRERGLDPAQAAERTRRAMQNYDMVGHFFDLGAKTPIGGNAFVRFSSELMRIAHNSAVDNPLRLASAVAAVVALTNLASQASGETPEDRKTREGRLGAPRVPFTNQSLEVQTPWGAINVGRLLGVTTYNDTNGGVAEDSKRLLPFQPPVTNTENGVKFNPNFLTADPLVGPMLGQAIDKDFRGKSIKDPENNGQFLDQLSAKDQLINRAKVAGMSYVPLANEANSAYSALRGQENFYGKKRSPTQAGLRIAGIKVEQYGPEQAKKQRGTDEYFKEKAKLDKEVATLPKKDQEAYKQATGYYKLREQVPNEFSPGDTRYKKAPVYNFPENKWGEYASSPKLYDLIKKDKEQKNKKGQPLQPEFDSQLSSEFRKQLISNKALAPGEDVEADQRLYSSSEWETYNQLKEKYKADAKKYYPDRGDGDFTDEMVKHQNAPFPTKGAAKKAYDDAYKLYTKGQGPKPQYNDQVDAEKEAYSTAQFNWTNTERKARGLPPISKEMWNNVTFGYESDEEKVYKQLKYGKGYGGYGSGGGGGSGSSDPYKYAVSLNQGSVGKPKAFKVSKSKAVAKKKIGKIKTKSVKSKV